MATVEVTITPLFCGEPETGGWCEACALPSTVTQRMALVSGLTVLKEMAVHICRDCGRKWAT
jgi:hypothetical protein